MGAERAGAEKLRLASEILEFRGVASEKVPVVAILTGVADYGNLWLTRTYGRLKIVPAGG